MQQTAAAVSHALFGPFADLLAHSRHILVAADGGLETIPLANLPSPDDLLGVGVPLGFAHAIAFQPSATAFLAARKAPTPAGTQPRPILALGGDTAGGSQTSLPGVRREVQTLARQFRDVDVRLRVAELDPAALAGYDVVHVAGHTFIDDAHPWNSAVLLRDDPDPERAVYLRAAGMRCLELPTRLCVLSGCESAAGRALPGLGLRGIAGAFLGSGVRTVLGTLWPVDDQTMQVLVESFYAALGRGRTCGAALQEAQASVRARPNRRHHSFGRAWCCSVIRTRTQTPETPTDLDRSRLRPRTGELGGPRRKVQEAPEGGTVLTRTFCESACDGSGSGYSLSMARPDDPCLGEAELVRIAQQDPDRQARLDAPPQRSSSDATACESTAGAGVSCGITRRHSICRRTSCWRRIAP